MRVCKRGKSRSQRRQKKDVRLSQELKDRDSKPADGVRQQGECEPSPCPSRGGAGCGGSQRTAGPRAQFANGCQDFSVPFDNFHFLLPDTLPLLGVRELLRSGSPHLPDVSYSHCFLHSSPLSVVLTFSFLPVCLVGCGACSPGGAHGVQWPCIVLGPTKTLKASWLSSVGVVKSVVPPTYWKECSH